MSITELEYDRKLEFMKREAEEPYSDVEIHCYNPMLKMIVGHYGRNDEYKTRVSAVTKPYLIYFFSDARHLVI